MKNRFLLLLAVIPVLLFSQTTEVVLEWQINPESDVYQYWVFRGVDAAPEQLYTKVNHPVVTYTDRQVTKGVRYRYKLQAVDYSLNASGFTAEVSAGIPKISGFQENYTMKPDSTAQFSLDNFVADPDHTDNQLTWSVSGAVKLQVSINPQTRILSVTTPSTWSGSETITLTALDPDQLRDTASLKFSASGQQSGQPPVIGTVPVYKGAEDHALQINLYDLVSDADTPDNQLNYSISDEEHFTETIQNGILTLTPQQNWFGSADFLLDVSDGQGYSDQSVVPVQIGSRNDAPVVAAVPDLTMGQGFSQIYEMDTYVSDVDHSDAQIGWTFSGLQKIGLSFNSTTRVLTLSSPLDWSGSETITATAADDSGSTDQSSWKVTVTAQAQPPVIGQIPAVQFAEDGSSNLSLNNYVSDGDDPDQNLIWSASGNTQVTVTINPVTNTALFSAAANWNGTENIWLVVTDPDQQKDSSQVSVQVTAVNDPPLMEKLPSVNLTTSTSASINLAGYVSDADHTDAQLTWSYSGNSSITVSISAQGVATFTRPQGWSGEENITIKSQDPLGGQDSESSLVYSQNINTAPVIINLQNEQFQEDNQKTVNLSTWKSDPDNQVNTLSWQAAADSWLNLSLAGDLLTIVPLENRFGTARVYLRLTDPDGHFDLDTMLVTVTAVNDAPQIQILPTIEMLSGTIYQLDLQTVISDADGWADVVKIELLGETSGYIGYMIDRDGGFLRVFSPTGIEARETRLLQVRDKAGVDVFTAITVEVIDQNIDGRVITSFYGSGTNILLQWQTRRSSKDHIQFGKTTAYTDITQTDAVFGNTHQQLIDALDEAGTYHFRIVSQTQDGRLSFSADSVFITGSGESDVRVFPVPYRASDPKHTDGIVFSNVADGDKIIIFDFLGEKVYQSEVTQPVVRWPVQNDSGKKVSSGIYFYIIKDGQGKKKSGGKLIVIR